MKKEVWLHSRLKSLRKVKSF